MAKMPATITRAATQAPAAKQGGTSGQSLLQQYENTINQGVGKGTEGNPLGDFREGADALWDQSSNLRGYADRLRSQQRGHEKSMLQTEISGRAQSDNFSVLKNLEGIKYQTDGGVKQAKIGAKTQVKVAGIQDGTQRYVADTGLTSDLASYASNEKIAGMGQRGENYRSGLQLAGSLLMNKDDNMTQRQGKFFDYMGNVANAQWRAPDVNNIKYWGG